MYIPKIHSQDDNFAMEAGRQPITFENPMYATAPGVSGDPAVIHATQVGKLLKSYQKVSTHDPHVPKKSKHVATDYL